MQGAVYMAVILRLDWDREQQRAKELVDSHGRDGDHFMDLDDGASPGLGTGGDLRSGTAALKPPDSKGESYSEGERNRLIVVSDDGSTLSTPLLRGE